LGVRVPSRPPAKAPLLLRPPRGPHTPKKPPNVPSEATSRELHQLPPPRQKKKKKIARITPRSRQKICFWPWDRVFPSPTDRSRTEVQPLTMGPEIRCVRRLGYASQRPAFCRALHRTAQPETAPNCWRANDASDTPLARFLALGGCMACCLRLPRGYRP